MREIVDTGLPEIGQPFSWATRGGGMQHMPLKVRAFWDYAFERLSALPQIHPGGRGK